MKFSRNIRRMTREEALAGFTTLLPYRSRELERPIPGRPNYFATTNGRIFHKLKRGHFADVMVGPFRVLKQWDDADGYKMVRIGTGKYKVHRLIVMAFEGKIPPGMHVAHLDGNCTNNDISNLRISTPLNNMRDRSRHGTTARGLDVGTVVVSEETVLEIRKLARQGWSRRALADKFDIGKTTVDKIVTRQTWRHL